MDTYMYDPDFIVGFAFIKIAQAKAVKQLYTWHIFGLLLGLQTTLSTDKDSN